MTKRISIRRIFAALIATAALAWLVDTVNTHSNETQQGLRNALLAAQAAPQPRSMEGAGLDLVDMVQCMCVSSNDEEFRRWVGWWFIAAIFGGVPVSVWLRSKTPS